MKLLTLKEIKAIHGAGVVTYTDSNFDVIIEVTNGCNIDYNIHGKSCLNLTSTGAFQYGIDSPNVFSADGIFFSEFGNHVKAVKIDDGVRYTMF